jgi:acyl-CoA synthetase (AMP-forming)/AMP-acid ligase II
MDWMKRHLLGDIVRDNAERFPDKVALIGPDGQERTFNDFNCRVNSLNQAVSSMGLTKGDRVAVLARNCPEYVEIYGLGKSGLIIVPLNWRLAAAEIEKLVAHSAPKVLFVDESFADLVDSIRSRLASVDQFVYLGAAREGWNIYSSLVTDSGAQEPKVTVAEDDVVCLMYTSGTTGAPKGVALTHRGVVGNCRVSSQNLLGLTADDVTLAVMPLFHAGGMWYHLFPSFATGCTTVMLREFDAAVVLSTLQDRHITNIHIVPTMLGALINHPAIDKVDVSRLRLIFYAASSIPADLLKQAMRAFGACDFVQAYGSTEAGILTVLNAQDHRAARQADREALLSSCGRPAADTEIQLLDDSDAPVSPRLIGEIVVRSDRMMKGYWLDPQATGRVLSDAGWFRTGDLGYTDQDGYLYIIDRKNDMIVTGGENVFPTEVEEFLYRDPDVLEAAVFGIPDPQWVERVVAAVVLRPGVQTGADEVLARLRRDLAGYKCPKQIYITQTLPKNAVGKILRKDLRKRYGVE